MGRLQVNGEAPPPFFCSLFPPLSHSPGPDTVFFFKRTTPVPFLHTQEATTTKATAPAKESNAAAAAAALAADERVPAKAAATNPARAADAADAATPKQQQQRKQKTVKLCVYGAGVDTDPCAAAVASALSPAPFSCVAAPSAQACAVAVARGDADVVRLGSDDTHAARSRHGLVPLAAEDYGSGDMTSYWSVAVVPESLCEGGGGKLTYADLRGARLCSTGYRKGAGWTTPVGTMMAVGALSAKRDGGGAPPGVADDAAAVAGFFGKVCAPRRTSSGPRVGDGGANGTTSGGGGGSLWPEGLCDGCLSQEEQDALPLAPGGKRRAFCEENAPESTPRPGGSDAWSGYSGAIECLLASLSSPSSTSSSSSGEGKNNISAAVVMFNKADAKASDGTKLADLAAAPSLRLFCPATSSCAPLSDYRNCNLGRVRAHALMSRPAWAASGDGAVAARALEALGGDAVGRLSKGAAPFFSGDAKSVVDCEEGPAGAGRYRSDYPAWYGLTRAYDALGGVGGGNAASAGAGSAGEGGGAAKRAVLTSSTAGDGGSDCCSSLSPGAIAGIVVGSLLGALAVSSAGVAVGRRVARRGSMNRAFVPSSSTASGF